MSVHTCNTVLLSLLAFHHLLINLRTNTQTCSESMIFHKPMTFEFITLNFRGFDTIHVYLSFLLVFNCMVTEEQNS